MTRRKKDNILERWLAEGTFDAKERQTAVRSYFGRTVPQGSDPIQFILLSSEKKRNR